LILTIHHVQYPNQGAIHADVDMVFLNGKRAWTKHFSYDLHGLYAYGYFWLFSQSMILAFMAQVLG
jgi:hypothetical protein